jgi:hypothetical protein
MKYDRSLLKWLALVLFIVVAILAFAKTGGEVQFGLLALGLAAWAAA